VSNSSNLGKGGKFGSLRLSMLPGLPRLAKPVTLAVHLEDAAMMGQTIHPRPGHPLAVEDLIPFAEWQAVIRPERSWSLAGSAAYSAIRAQAAVPSVDAPGPVRLGPGTSMNVRLEDLDRDVTDEPSDPTAET
jgi:hypothetical protein